MWKRLVWNPSKCICKNGKRLASIIDDSATICDEVVKSSWRNKNYSYKF